MSCTVFVPGSSWQKPQVRKTLEEAGLLAAAKASSCFITPSALICSAMARTAALLSRSKRSAALSLLNDLSKQASAQIASLAVWLCHLICTSHTSRTYHAGRSFWIVTGGDFLVQQLNRLCEISGRHHGEPKNGILFKGVANNLARCIHEHWEEAATSITVRYDVSQLVCQEESERISEADVREKKLKRCRRARKLKLIEMLNPFWRDLCRDFA